MAFSWIEEPVVALKLPSGNTVKVKRPDLLDLVMSDQAGAIPDTLLQQISDSFSGNAKDRELVCHSFTGDTLPGKGEPVVQGQVRGRVVEAVGDNEQFRVTVSMLTEGSFKVGEVRFGGIRLATVAQEGEARWRPAAQDLPKFGEFIRLMVKASTVEPRMVDVVTDPETELALSRMTSADKMAIFQWGMPQEVRPAGKFPEEPAAGVAATYDVQAIPPVASNGAGAETPVGEVAV